MAIDIAEPLVSFDTDKCAVDTLQFMNKNGLEVVGVRRDGVVAGYVQQQDLTGGKCGDHMHCFDKGIVLAETSFYPEVIDCLSMIEILFYFRILGSVGAIITQQRYSKTIDENVAFWNDHDCRNVYCSHDRDKILSVYLAKRTLLLKG